MKKHKLEWLMPEFPRIPHLPFRVHATDDDIISDADSLKKILVSNIYIQEKIDGANAAISWTPDGIAIRNRTHILNRGYKSDTSAKKQFVSLWTWAEQRATREKIHALMDLWHNRPLTIYGEWMLLQHGTIYDNLPDKFIAYAVYLPEDNLWIVGDYAAVGLEGCGFVIPPVLFKGQLSSIDHLYSFVGLPSEYSRSGEKAEGIVVNFSDNLYKMVREDYVSNKYWDNKKMNKHPCWN